MKEYVTTVLCAAALFFSLDCRADEPETVAIIGTGYMGSAIGPRMAKLGYRVIYGSRDPGSDKVRALVEATGANASATEPEAAARHGNIVFLLVPWPPMENVAQNLGNLDGKIVVDVSMPFAQGEDGYPEHLLETSSAEMIQDWNPGARVVKAFATMGYYIIDDPMAAGGKVTIPIASDDREAKEKVAKIAAAMGLDPVDFGPLRMARNIEIMQMIYMIPLSQNRPQAWEFFFRRSDHFGCYLAGEDNSEGINPVYDSNNLAIFPGDDQSRTECVE